ncbi:nitroreductase family deazaflavin-dependent oxidoreductase [Actinomadura sp. 21ATH]|uniref:nitroreductase family deazaflavin-dependent oxidoreductase n=1 Tax=Actinomadura sp. 21ATH TaxID=1735444 RepID=UPI0035BFF3C3
MEIVRRVDPPKGIGRWLFRLPLHAYRWGFGWVFGHRILVLHHVGRVTGKRRQVVLEVVSRDAGGYVVASGFGRKSAWYRNIEQKPDVVVQVGGRVVPVTAEPLGAEAGAEVFGRYASRHRFLAKRLLPRLMGYSVDGSEEDFRAVGLRIPFVRLVPRV